MGKNARKRSHAQFTQDAGLTTNGPKFFGVAEVLARLKQPEPLLNGKTTDRGEAASPLDEWEVVDRASRRRKPQQKQKRSKSREGEEVCEQEKANPKSNRPALTYTELHKLQTCTKIRDLQDLVLYCLADGTSPQWISVRHHGHVRKAVVLLVPGLEKDMFKGHVKLEEASVEGNVNRPPLETDGILKEVGRNDEVVHTSSNHANRADYSYRRSNISPDDYLPMNLVSNELPTPLKPLAGIFNHVWPVKAPGDDKYYKVHSPLHAMLTSPIPKSQEEKRAEKNIKGAKPAREGKYWENRRTPITTFIASNEDLLENEYTLHPVCFATEQEKESEVARRRATNQDSEHGWKDTSVDRLADGNIPDGEFEQGSLTAGRTVLALDCEMCMVEGGEFALTRISIIGWDGSMVMDELVRPDKPITDYLTPYVFYLFLPFGLYHFTSLKHLRYSGITAAKLAPVTTTLSEIQSRLLTLLTPATIIIGHSLNSDLAALKLTHPFIIDTSIIYQHPRGPPLKSSLKWLSQKYLSREIQKGHGVMGHDSIEDARACLDLVKMKCEKGAKWGTVEATGESIFKRLARTPNSNLSTTSQADGKTGAIVDHGSPERNFGAMARYCIGCTNDEEVVTGVRRAVQGDADGATIPGGGVDFTWARLRDLEALRGWSNDHRKPVANTSITSTTPSSPAPSPPGPTPSQLSHALAATTSHILAIHALLQPCTLLVVYSGTGDPQEMARLHAMKATFRDEYRVKKWDELSVKWTDEE
ncbi:hypothetical protein MMC06_006667, partial [Schaereria dolodes]|nr:hypothetical protein [Schaereria dolodes]